MKEKKNKKPKYIKDMVFGDIEKTSEWLKYAIEYDDHYSEDTEEDYKLIEKFLKNE